MYRAPTQAHQKLRPSDKKVTVGVRLRNEGSALEAETLNDNVEDPHPRIALRSRPQDVEQPLEEEQVDLVLGLGLGLGLG
jgi:hypothetical protein